MLPGVSFEWNRECLDSRMNAGTVPSGPLAKMREGLSLRVHFVECVFFALRVHRATARGKTPQNFSFFFRARKHLSNVCVIVVQV